MRTVAASSTSAVKPISTRSSRGSLGGWRMSGPPDPIIAAPADLVRYHFGACLNGDGAERVPRHRAKGRPRLVGSGRSWMTWEITAQSDTAAPQDAWRDVGNCRTGVAAGKQTAGTAIQHQVRRSPVPRHRQYADPVGCLNETEPRAGTQSDVTRTSGMEAPADAARSRLNVSQVTRLRNVGALRR
jgi:hypothetical protein